ncbi:hypothetical protein AWB76_03291 [Caballeronia temeraria]|uniref:Uncharacterized protein n=1 Tax=Caballeronia temeraria TaxID=1777137 RepID=A0A158AY62_9BURK|nr:hypothetical protein [Caballeronia temeraria]SAK62673.1 hypothetical protein AWB76_03291 [Caballeronia temeraria]
MTSDPRDDQHRQPPAGQPGQSVRAAYGMGNGDDSDIDDVIASRYGVQPGALSKSMQRQQQAPDAHDAQQQHASDAKRAFAHWLENYVKNIVKHA